MCSTKLSEASRRDFGCEMWATPWEPQITHHLVRVPAALFARILAVQSMSIATHVLSNLGHATTDSALPYATFARFTKRSSSSGGVGSLTFSKPISG